MTEESQLKEHRLIYAVEENQIVMIAARYHYQGRSGIRSGQNGAGQNGAGQNGAGQNGASSGSGGRAGLAVRGDAGPTPAGAPAVAIGVAGSVTNGRPVGECQVRMPPGCCVTVHPVSDFRA